MGTATAALLIFPVFFQEGSYARPAGWYQHIWTAWRLEGFEEKGGEQKRSWGFSQFGAGSGILERKLLYELHQPQEGPAWLAAVQKVTEFGSRHRQRIAADCRSGKCKAKQISFMIPALNACTIATVCIYALGDLQRGGLFPPLVLPKWEVLHNRQVLDALERMLLGAADRKVVQAERSLLWLLHLTAATLQLHPPSASRCKPGSSYLLLSLEPCSACNCNHQVHEPLGGPQWWCMRYPLWPSGKCRPAYSSKGPWKDCRGGKKMLWFKLLYTPSCYNCFSIEPPLKNIIRGHILMDNPCLQM